MSHKYRVGQHVKWNYAGGTAEGKIKETFTDKVTRKLKGHEVTRNASSEEPAYLIEQDDGDQVLKSESELHKA